MQPSSYENLFQGEGVVTDITKKRESTVNA